MGRSGKYLVFGSVTKHWAFVWAVHNAIDESLRLPDMEVTPGVLQYDVSGLHRGRHSFCFKAGTVVHRVRVFYLPPAP